MRHAVAQAGCFHQALLAPVHLRKNETLPQIAARFGASIATAWRYVDETLEALAFWAPGLPEALAGPGEGDFVVVARPDGTPLWFSRAAPGCTHDLTAARAHGIVQACLTRQILVLADRAYQGAGATFRTPYHRHSEQPELYQQVNRDHARLRDPGERAFAQLRTWRLLRRARCSTRRIGTAVQTVHTLLTCKCSG